MKLLIELPDGYVGVVMRNQRIDGSAMDKLLRQAVIDGTPLDEVVIKNVTTDRSIQLSFGGIDCLSQKAMEIVKAGIKDEN